MVVEVADSEGQSQVDADARWWLENLDGDVKIALTIPIQNGDKRDCHLKVGGRRSPDQNRPA
ncbi:hypothetical protein BDFG_05304 [Blastomyces dermatitidis ATCC 26199]|nr:hypothetical protein BDFG_05304 [Blastomyces dermatitidis ATCC 26199]